jgi:pimeloyl-ACP methyl ester carboxylesterase
MGSVNQATATFITVGDAAIWVEAAGDGPAVVFLHAGIADSRMWDAEVQALQGTHRVVRLDLRGWGRSQLVPGTFSYYGDVLAVLDALKIEKATVVGCSFGGNVALDITVAHSERVERLILISPSIGDGHESPEIRAFGEREDAALERGDPDGATEENVRFWVVGSHRKRDDVDPKVCQLVFDMQRLAFDNPIPEGLTVERLDPPARERLGEIRVPTLIVVGDLDVDHVGRVARRLSETIPGARLEVMRGTAHVPTLEKPTEWLDLLRETLEGL